MILSNVTSVFSRYFVVGFFIPPFVVLVLLWKTLSPSFPPDVLKYGEPGDVAVLGGVALVLGLLLSAYHVPIRAGLEGDIQGRPLNLLLGPALKWLKGRERVRRAGLQRVLAEADESIETLEDAYEVFSTADPHGPLSDELRRSLDEERARKVQATRTLPRYFPGEDEDVLPTRLGNTTRAWQYRVYKRWGLDTYAVLPHVKQLLTPQERERHSDPETDLAFFVNSSIVATGAGVAYFLDWIIYRSWYEAWWIGAFVAAFRLYRSAVGAAARYGDELSSSIDIHRFELYFKFGLREPETPEHEQAIGELVNASVLSSTPIGQRDRRPVYAEPDLPRPWWRRLLG